jgi:GH15 family glucan-1,4-alpha-glucosidase
VTCTSRDASFTLFALIRLGCTAEAGNFMHWIEDRCMDLNPDGSMQIVYGCDGRKLLTESTLDNLEGYRGSSPVRVGNGA